VAKRSLMEQVHLSVFAPSGLPAHEYDAIRQALDGPRLHTQLRRAVGHLIRRHRSLSKVKAAVPRCSPRRPSRSESSRDRERGSRSARARARASPRVVGDPVDDRRGAGAGVSRSPRPLGLEAGGAPALPLADRLR
jgi:hypothetical protein